MKRWTFALCLFLGAIGVLLFFEHRAHLLGALPYLLLLACPVIHILMHRRHGTHAPSHGATHDPVCGMIVDPGQAAEERSVGGQRYFFCSRACVEKFDADPAVYTHSGGHAQHHAC